MRADEKLPVVAIDRVASVVRRRARPIDPAVRDHALDRFRSWSVRVYTHTRPGGAFILVEKVLGATAEPVPGHGG